MSATAHAWFSITISRDDDQVQGLAPLREIITNGLSCIITEYEVEECTNATTIRFCVDPASIEPLLEGLEQQG